MTVQQKPDFVVETADIIYMIETKAEKDINNNDVQEKKKAAMEYCTIVSKETSKPWQYVLIPHKAITRTMQLQFVIANSI